MIMVETEARKWGNSIGVVIPREVAEREHIKESEKVKLLIIRDGSKTLKETFGIAKGKIKKPTQQIKDELREELDG